jgi:hypothetical protein
MPTAKERFAPVHTFRVAIALPEWLPETRAERAVVTAVDRLRPVEVIDASVSFGWGIGAYGTEQCVFIDTATPERGALARWIVSLLVAWNQECAYVSVDGQPFELNVDSVWSPITGQNNS